MKTSRLAAHVNDELGPSASPAENHDVEGLLSIAFCGPKLPPEAVDDAEALPSDVRGWVGATVVVGAVVVAVVVVLVGGPPLEPAGTVYCWFVFMSMSTNVLMITVLFCTTMMRPGSNPGHGSPV